MSVFVCASNSEPYSCSSEANFKWLCTKGSTLSRSVSLDQQIHRRSSAVLEVKVVLLLKEILVQVLQEEVLTRSKKKRNSNYNRVEEVLLLLRVGHAVSHLINKQRCTLPHNGPIQSPAPTPTHIGAISMQAHICTHFVLTEATQWFYKKKIESQIMIYFSIT